MSQLIRNPLYKVVVQNTQSSPTPAPFQQLLTLDLSDIVSQAEELLNLRFCADDGCQSPLYAWVESYNSDFSSVYIWVKIPYQIPANSQFPLYVTKENVIQYPFTGMAPQLTATYAQYDNGENVFTFYDNFAGTSLNTNKWGTVVSAGSITVNNGLVLKGGTSQTNGENAIYTLQSWSAPIIFDYYSNMAVSPSGATYSYPQYGFSNYIGSSAACPGCGGTYTLLGMGGGAPGCLTSQGGTITAGNIPYPSSSPYNLPFGVYTEIYTVSEFIGLFNYGEYTLGSITGANNTASLPFVLNAGNNEASYAPNGMTVYWVRARQYPPNGVMPSLVAFLGV